MEIKNTGQMDAYSRAQLERTEQKTINQIAGQVAGHAHTQAAPKSDKVTLSPEGALHTEAYRSAMNAPEIRQDKVDAIKDQISNGTYVIDSAKIAAGLINQESLLLS